MGSSVVLFPAWTATEGYNINLNAVTPRPLTAAFATVSLELRHLRQELFVHPQGTVHLEYYEILPFFRPINFTAAGEVGEEHGTVRITVSDMVGSEVLPPILATIHAVHPGISVELALSNRNEDLLRGDADIAVRMVRPTQGALVAKRIGRIDVGLYGHRRYLKGHAMPRRLEDLRQHALIGYDRDQAYARLLERMGVPFTRDMFAFRSDSDLAQLAALRAGLGIGASQIGLARRNKNLVPVLHSELILPMEVWLVMHRDLRSSRRIRLTFDHLAAKLTDYAVASQIAVHSIRRP